MSNQFEPCTLSRFPYLLGRYLWGSAQAPQQHPEVFLTVASFRTWRGWGTLCRTGPGTSTPLQPTPKKQVNLVKEFRPAYGGFRVQGTTSSPLSTAPFEYIHSTKNVKGKFNRTTYTGNANFAKYCVYTFETNKARVSNPGSTNTYCRAECDARLNLYLGNL